MKTDRTASATLVDFKHLLLAPDVSQLQGVWGVQWQVIMCPGGSKAPCQRSCDYMLWEVDIPTVGPGQGEKTNVL